MWTLYHNYESQLIIKQTRKGRKWVAHQSNPEDDVLVYEAAEVLVEDEEAGAYKGRVLEVQLTFGDVCDLQENGACQWNI